VRLDGLGQLRSRITFSGIQPATYFNIYADHWKILKKSNANFVINLYNIKQTNIIYKLLTKK
jgi:hypothetical protein